MIYGAEGIIMAVPLVPDNQEVLAILAASISGSYRFVHHALIPYVRVGPATERHAVGLQPSAQFMLKGDPPYGDERFLQGVAATIDLAVVFEGSRVVLREVPYRAAQLDQLEAVKSPQPIGPPRKPQQPRRRRPPREIHIGDTGAGAPVFIETPLPPTLAHPVPGHVVRQAPVQPLRRPVRLEVAPAWQSDEPSPPVPDALRDICAREDVHPELGDYLVIPPTATAEHEPLPRWVVRFSEVQDIHVVKPREQSDTTVEPAGAP